MAHGRSRRRLPRLALLLTFVAVTLCDARTHAQPSPSRAEVFDREYGDLLRILERHRTDEAGALDELRTFWAFFSNAERDQIPLLIKRLPMSLAPRMELALTDLAFDAFRLNQKKLANENLETVEAFIDWTLGNEAQGTRIEHDRQWRFANDWYQAILWLRFARLERNELFQILERAKWRFPGDPDLSLGSAAFEELELNRLRGERHSGSRQLTGGTQSVDLTMREARAIRLYREAIRLDPKSAEARIRVAYMQMYHGDREEALTMLTEAYALDAKPPLSYLAALFAGDLEERNRKPDVAALWYRRAIAACPRAQTARLAYSHLLMLQNDDVRPAQNALRPLIGGPNKISDACEPDPWRLYEFGPAWRLNPLLDSLHKQVREAEEKSS